MFAPLPPQCNVQVKKYQRGQKIATELGNSASSFVPGWFKNSEKRQPNSCDVYAVITRDDHKGLGIIEDVITRHGVPHNKVTIAFDIDRTLRIGTSNGLQSRDPNTLRILQNLAEKGTTLWAITGAHAESNPAVEDATLGAMERIRPIGLDKFFVDEATPSKETIVKTDEWQIRHRGRILVSTEKDVALDFFLCCVTGVIDEQGELKQDKKPELLVFVDDSDVHVLSVLKKFKYSSCVSLPVVSILFEPTLEMAHHNPLDGDNPKPGIIDQIYENQIDCFKLEENLELIQSAYKIYNMPVPQKYLIKVEVG